MAEIRLSRQVQTFLEREVRYLQVRSPAAAAAFLRRLDETKLNLSRFPEMGRRKDAPPIRNAIRLVVDDYVVDYRYYDGIVTLMTIRHARQNDPDMPDDNLW